MHSPLEIAKEFVEIGVHKVKLSVWKMFFWGVLRAALLVLQALRLLQHQP